MVVHIATPKSMRKQVKTAKGCTGQSMDLNVTVPPAPLPRAVALDGKHSHNNTL